MGESGLVNLEMLIEDHYNKIHIATWDLRGYHALNALNNGNVFNKNRNIPNDIYDHFLETEKMYYQHINAHYDLIEDQCKTVFHNELCKHLALALGEDESIYDFRTQILKFSIK